MEMDTCRKSGIEEISNYAVRLQDKELERILIN